MAFERLKMSLQLDTSGFESNLQSAQSDLGSFGDRAANVGSTMQSVGTKMTAGVTAPLGAMAAGSASAAASFDEAMTESMSVMGDVSDSMREDLEQTARDVATSMNVSHQESAESFYYLASAGLDAAESMEAMPEVAALASAANMDMADATDVATNVMSAFGKEADQLADVTDRMTAVTQNHNQTMEGMAGALSRVAPTAAGVGVELGELNAAIGQLGDQGIQGQRAGTALNTAISQMADETSPARQELEEMGVQVENAQGEMLPLAEIFTQLEQAGADAGDMAAIFGTQAGPAMAALLQEGGDALDEHADAINDAEGATEEMAKTQQDTLNAQLDILRSNIRDAGITIGANLLPALNSLVERLRPIAESFQNLSDRQQTAIIGFGAIAAALGPILAGFGTLLTLIPAMQAGWAALAAVKLGAVVPAAAATVTALSPILAPLAAITAAVGALWYAWDNNLGGIQDLTRDVASSIVGAIRPVISVLRDGVGEAVSTLQQRWQTFVSIVRPPLESLFSWLGGVYNQYVQPVEEDLIQTAEVWKDAFMGFVEWIQPYLQQFFDWYVGTIQANLERVQAFWDSHGDTIMAIIQPFIETVEYLFTSMMDTLSTVVRAGLAVLRGDFEGAVTMLNDLLERQVDRFTDYGRSMMEALADGIRAMASAPVDAVEGVVDDVRDRLPSSPAEEGPLSDLDESGEALPQTFGQGIEDGSGDLDRTLETQLEGMDSPGVEPLAQASANGQGGQSSQDPLTREDLTVAFKRALQEVVFETNVDFNDKQFNRFIDDRASTVVDEKLTKTARRASTRMG